VSNFLSQTGIDFSEDAILPRKVTWFGPIVARKWNKSYATFHDLFSRVTLSPATMLASKKSNIQREVRHQEQKFRKEERGTSIFQGKVTQGNQYAIKCR
jgi:hypothetical protein